MTPRDYIAMDYAVETFNLTKTFKIRKGKKDSQSGRFFSKGEMSEINAVDHINLKIRRGELFGLLGPNGAGKTTTIRLLATLLLPSEGSAKVNGYDVVKEPDKVRESIGVVMMGERSLYWRLTGRENLEYFAALHHIPPKMWKERIDSLLEFVGLADRGDDLVEKYSSGMKQRLTIARCLLHDPPVLMLDEPTLGLDPGAARSIRNMIKNLRDQGKTIILTTHYMKEAEELCDRVGIIHKGKIIALDSPANLKTKVKEEEVLEIEATNLSDSLVTYLKKIDEISEAAIIVTDPVISSGTIRILARDSRRILPSVLACLSQNDVNIQNIKVSEPTLEDIFIQLTGENLEK